MAIRSGNVLVKSRTVQDASGEMMRTFKLCDFGISRALGMDGDSANANEERVGDGADRAITSNIGTPLYMVDICFVFCAVFLYRSGAFFLILLFVLFFFSLSFSSPFGSLFPSFSLFILFLINLRVRKYLRMIRKRGRHIR